MRKNDYLLTFEMMPASEEVEIHCDRQGLEFLLQTLQRILKTEQQHEHLFTPAWGGKELSEEKQNNESQLSQKVTVHYWK